MSVECSDGTGSNFFDYVRVGSHQVSHRWFGFRKFPLKIPKFSIFVPFGYIYISSGRVKKYPDWLLIYCGSKVCSGQVGSGQKEPGSKTGGPLIYCGSKVCSGQVRVHLKLNAN